MNFLLHPLNLVTFFPLLGVLVILFLKPAQKSAGFCVFREKAKLA